MKCRCMPNESNQYRCCFCCHVKTATICIGIFHALGTLFLLTMMAVYCIRPELLEFGNPPPPQSYDLILASPDNGSTEETNRSSSQHSSDDVYSFMWMIRKPFTYEDKLISLLLLIGSFLLAVMLIYGVVKKDSRYLLPFGAFQCADLCLTCLAILGFSSTSPNIKRWISLQNIPYKDVLLTMDPSCLMVLGLIVVTATIFIKVYLMGIVWSCYRYLGAVSYRNFFGRSSGVVAPLNDSYYCGPPLLDDTKIMMPPKYEDVAMPVPDYETSQSSAPTPPPPPPYVAVGSQANNVSALP